MTTTRIVAKWGLSALAIGILGSAALAQSQVFKFDNTPELFDASSGSRTFTVTPADMAGGTAVNRVTIAIDFEKYDGGTLGVNGGDTPFYDEIVFTLTNPQNVTTTLIGADSFNFGADGFRGVITFDDLASLFVNDNPDSPQAGTFKPILGESLSALNSADGVGDWILGIQDTTGADHLGYYSASLEINGPTASAPEPGTLALGLLGVGGLWLRRRRA
ncbi:MAG: PEP-CTERM sorting domain-containing protein [Armatimonas sp.]